MSPEANAPSSNYVGPPVGPIQTQPLTNPAALPETQPQPQISSAQMVAPARQEGQTSELNLDKVDINLVAYIKRKYPFVLLAMIFAIGGGFLSPVISVLVIAGGLALAKNLYENSLFKAFANSNGFNFQNQGIVPAQTGHLFFVGRARSITDVVSGTFENWPFLLFLFKYDIGTGRNRKTFHRAVLNINFDVKLPTFILRRNGVRRLLNEEGERIKSNGYSEKLQLEGDFNKHFDVFVPPNTEQDALNVLTPDIMQMLMPLDKYEVEITPSGELYIYTFKYITKRSELVDVYDIVRSLIPKIGNYASLQKIVNNQVATPPTSPLITNRPVGV